MAPAGLLKREHAVDGSSWTRKRIHSKLGARSGAFLGLKSTGLSLGKNNDQVFIFGSPILHTLYIWI
jgi:hypothetical protein